MERVHGLRRWFDENAGSYDRVAQALSLGSGNWYRSWVVARLGLPANARVLDVACGTGVLAWAAHQRLGPAAAVFGLDPSLGMIQAAKKRGVQALVVGTAESLPFASATFDALFVGYALRHFSDLELVFREFRRVLREGGQLLMLEITPPNSALGRRLLKLYLGSLVPAFARWYGRSASELFRYYWDTIEQCVSPETILQVLLQSGFATATGRTELGIFREYVAHTTRPG